MRIITVSLLFFSILLPAAAQAAEKIAQRSNLSYQVYIGGLRLLTADMQITQAKPQDYEIVVNARTTGLARLLTPWTGTITARGIYKDGAPQPLFYESLSKWPHNTITKRFTYNEDGSLATLFIEDDEAPDKTPQPLSLGDNSRDLLSALLFFAENALTDHACAGESPVFDGTRRFMLTESNGGQERLSASRYNIYSGPAMHCQYQMTPHGGRWHENLIGWMAGFYGAQTQKDKPSAWYGRISGDNGDILALPVKLRAKVKYGTAFVHVTNIAIQDFLLEDIEPAGGEKITPAKK